ncbi:MULTISPECIES: curli production assembly/transport protein CsgE [Ferrimonas]|uniref:curli production assembly/transport protein CsgE n=1 Tax=Ferrimonas TaxID=44011 RepID=UPI0004156417|nr:MULTISPECIES: curli production assembly/transport protein CsgE [Ferrimonas]USD37068.1 curli production assembly/transport protein CsgE [Ferrimonas sp. SCSIO 43195]
MMWRALLLSLPLLLSAPAWAQEDDIELDGLLVDRTLTRFGKDFLYYYSGYWRDLPGTQGFIVTVSETVYPQAGTRLWIEVNQTKIYETYFGRRHNNMKERADQAMLVTIDHVTQVKANIMLGQHDDHW